MKLINAKAKGNAFEVLIAQELRDLGYQAVTSRFESKSLDDQGVDLVDNTDFYFQLKRVEALRPVDDIIASMPKTKTRVVLHKRSQKPAMVSMTWTDFKRLLLEVKTMCAFCFEEIKNYDPKIHTKNNCSCCDKCKVSKNPWD